MIIDHALQMATDEAVTDAAKQLGDIIDLKKPGNGLAHNPHLRIQVKEAVTSGGSATVTFDLQTSEDEAFTAPVTLLSSGAIDKAALTLNKIAVDLPVPEAGLLQYIRVYVTPSATLITGKFDAHIGY